MRLRQTRRVKSRRHANIIGRLLTTCFFTFFVFVLRREPSFYRAAPRLLREIKRNSVNWEARLIDARSQPIFDNKAAPPVFVISLLRTPARRARLIHELVKARIHHEIFFAVDGKKAFAHEDIQNFAGDRRRSRLIPTGLQDSQTYMSTDIDLDLHERLRFGCYLSHIHLWEKIVASNRLTRLFLKMTSLYVRTFTTLPGG